jgi:hypothetical protein
VEGTAEILLDDSGVFMKEMQSLKDQLDEKALQVEKLKDTIKKRELTEDLKTPMVIHLLKK